MAMSSTKTSASSASLKLPHPQVDILLLAGRPSVVRHRHVLRVLKGLTVQEEGAFSRLLLLQTVQHEVHAKTWRSD